MFSAQSPRKRLCCYNGIEISQIIQGSCRNSEAKIRILKIGGTYLPGTFWVMLIP